MSFSCERAIWLRRLVVKRSHGVLNISILECWLANSLESVVCDRLKCGLNLYVSSQHVASQDILSLRYDLASGEAANNLLIEIPRCGATTGLQRFAVRRETLTALVETPFREAYLEMRSVEVD